MKIKPPICSGHRPVENSRLHRDGLHHMQAVPGPRNARGQHTGADHRIVLQRGGGAPAGRAVRGVAVEFRGLFATEGPPTLQGLELGSAGGGV